MTWDAPGTVLVIGAVFAGVVTIIKTWQTGSKVDALAADTSVKLEAIHKVTDGGLDEVKDQNKALVEQLRAVLADHQNATNIALAASLAKNVMLEAEVVKRADATIPRITDHRTDHRKEDI